MNTKKDNKTSESLYVVGIGASAGGLEAISILLANIPNDINNLAIIIAQHLSPTYKSMLTQLLSRETNLAVVEIKDGMKINNRTVYITPSANEVTIYGKVLKLKSVASKVGPKPSVDILFNSIAEWYGNNAIGIILSGTGSDGAVGIRAIKLNKGVTMVQEPRTAKYDGMPVAALETGIIDIVEPPDSLAKRIKQIIKGESGFDQSINSHLIDNSDGLSKVYRLLTKRTGTDFTNYKHATLSRRLEKRLSVLNITEIEKYLSVVEKNPKELDALLSTVLIGVTAFFRDKDSFHVLEEQIEKLISKKEPGSTIRIWIPGCATGEEPYSIAIILNSVLGNKINEYRIQIFATDIDDRAIAIARRGVYAEQALENVSKDIKDAFFLKKENDFELIKSIKSMVLFSKHDVISNPPFLKLDLISCRNLLIYFGLNLQKQIMPIFHYALQDNGFLFLGKSESVGHFSNLFSVIDSKHKLFKKRYSSDLPNLSFAFHQNSKVHNNYVKTEKPKSLHDHIKDTIFNTYEYPYVIINEHMEVKEVKGNTRDFLSLSEGNINLNILKMAHKDLQFDIRNIISKALKEDSEVKAKIKKYSLFDKIYFLRLVVKPVMVEDYIEYYVLIFEYFDLQESLEINKINLQPEDEGNRIKELEHDLEITKENLQTYIEEVETSNEELQSLNEEMQSTNEELQSSNEELETSNEELQATNEELQIAYGELKAANEALESKDRMLVESESNIQALLNNKLHASILIDKNFIVLAFNKKAQQFIRKCFKNTFHLKDNLLDFITSEFVQILHSDIKKASKGNNFEVYHTIEDYRGEKHYLHLYYSPIVNVANQMTFSMAFIDITYEMNLRSELADSEKLLRSVFNSVSVGLIVTDSKGDIIKVNKTYCETFGYPPSEIATQNFFAVFPIEQRVTVKEQYQEQIKSHKNFEGELTFQRKDGSLIEGFVSSVLLERGHGDGVLIVTSIRDISESKKIRKLLVETQESMKVGGWEIDLITSQNTWTEEVYHIYEVPETFDVNIENGLTFYDKPGINKLEEALKNAIEKGEAYDLELPFTSAKNNKKWVRCTCKPIRAQHRTIRLYGTIQDITQRKLYEERLIRMSKALESSSDAIRISDSSGQLLYANKSYLKLLGYKQEELNHEGGIFAVYEDKAKGEEIFNTVKDGNAWQGELSLISKTGKVIPVHLKSDAIWDDSGSLIGFMATITDISVRKKHQEYLRLMESVVVNTNDAVIITESSLSDEGSKIVYVNSAFTKMTGYSREEVLGVTHRILHGPKTSREELAKIRRALVKKIPAHAEIVNYRKDGSIFWVNFSIVPIVNENNITTHHISIQRDVTDRKIAEVELTNKYKELEKTNSELDRFVYSASHDLRAPLASVLGLINLVKMDEKEPHHLEYLTNMQKSIHKLDKFIGDIINYSRNSRLEVIPEDIDLKELVEELKEDLGFMDSAEKINIGYDGEGSVIVSDRSRIKVVLSNLISNAIKYHNLRVAHPYIKVKYKKEDDNHMISVIDNGPGIPIEHKTKIFDMFYRGSESSSGSGLGLYIVKETISKLDGDISLETRLGEGSNFTIKFPDNDFKFNDK